jgi:myo-inositol-1(or 4)-monophosphatase
VQILAPYTRVIKDEEPAHEGASGVAPAKTPDATQAFVDAAAPEADAAAPAPVKKAPVRIRRADATPPGDDAPM